MNETVPYISEALAMTATSHFHTTDDTTGSAGPDGDVEAARPGRPRDEAREAAILDAALELVTEVGFDKMSMDAVAARAKASKATIYRWWPGKLELVIEAIRRRVSPDEVIPADTGSLRGDLLAAVELMCSSMSGSDGALICGLASACRSDSEMGVLLKQHFQDEKRDAAAEIFRRAMGRGELSGVPDCTLLFEVAPGVALNRAMVGEELDESFAAHLVDDILLPVIHASAAAAAD